MINTGVPSTLNVPQTFHSFTYLYANRSLVSLPQRIALVGMMSATGATGVAGTIYEVADATQTDGLFGVGSELALMCRMAFACSAFLQKGPRVYACPIAAPAGTATTQTITVTGAATADGNAQVTIAGRTIVFGIRNGDVANTIAAALQSGANLISQSLPVAPTVAANVVTLTHRTNGVNGNDVRVAAVQTVPGVTIAVATSVVGTGVASIQVAIDALATLRYDGIAFGNHTAADVTIINADVQARWAPADKGWRWYFLGESGTIGTATSLSSAANHTAVVVGSCYNCPQLAGEIATFLAMATFSRERPMELPPGFRGKRSSGTPPTGFRTRNGMSLPDSSGGELQVRKASSPRASSPFPSRSASSGRPWYSRKSVGPP